MEHDLGDKAFTKKMISPTQAEKIYNKTDFDKLAEFIIKPTGKPTLAKESDKKESINCINDFEVLK